MARLYFRQLLAGRDFGADNPVASQMQNFVYLIGDEDTRECVVVDPAWAVDDLVSLVEADGMRITGALATHYHRAAHRPLPL
jgi:hydroxyacylglutathione hydrolase